jgi:F420-dependent oxidoreductase-like protein
MRISNDDFAPSRELGDRYGKLRRRLQMKLGVHLVNFGFPGGAESIRPTIAKVGEAAERAGVGNLSLMDHYLQMEGMGLGDADAPMLEGYTGLGFLAAHTQTAELQLLVTGVTYRHPGLLAKIVSTLDVLSGGRAALGIGAAWYQREHEAYGVPFPPVAERFERLEEALQIVRQMWSDDTGPYQGKHYQLAETINSPQPIRQPRPPIMIGGSGERKTLRLLAKYADACNLFASPNDGLGPVKAKLDVLAGHCEREGTDYDRIHKTILWNQALTPDAESGKVFTDHMARYAAIGIQAVHVMPMSGDPVSFINGLGEHVIPTLNDIT